MGLNRKSHKRPRNALERKLFEDQKVTIKLIWPLSSVVDEPRQEKIDVVKSRLIRNYGYCDQHSEGSFDEWLDMVVEHPEVTRAAYQRLYDMIMAHGTEEVYEQKEKITHYKFFTE
jgi:predicted Ser/Thr protein kinase